MLNYKSKVAASVVAVAVCAFAGILSANALGQQEEENETTGHDTLSHPIGKITPWAAMKIAAASSHGKAFQAMYELDEGHWVYGVDVVKGHKLFEVEVNPTTGKVGETEAITPKGEGQEMAGDLAKMAHAGG